MHALRQHDNHTRLRRVLAQKLQSREAVLGSRSPQFGHGFGGPFGGGGSGRGDGNGNGNGGGRGDRDGPGRGNGGFGGFGGFGGGNNGNGGPGRGNGNGGGRGPGSGNGGENGPGSGSGGGDGPGNGNGSDNNDGGSNPTPQPSPTNSPVNNPPAPSPTPPSPPVDSGSPPSRGNDGNTGSGVPSPGSGSWGTDPKPESDSPSSTGVSTGDNTKGTSTAAGDSDATSGANTATISFPSNSATALGSVPNTSTVEGVEPSAETGTGSPLITGATEKNGLPAGAVAGIVVVCLLFFLLLLAFVIRRRWVSRRRDRMQRWWFTRKRDSQVFEEKAPHPVYNEKSLPAIPQTDASSVELRSASPFDLTKVVPTAPPMAEVCGHHGQTGHYTQTDSDRMSLNSVNLGSTESDSSQYIVLRNPLRRPSERESFKFPIPPSNAPSVALSIHSRSGSGHSGFSKTSLAASLPGPSSMSRPPLTAPPPPLKMDVIPNPFMDPGLASASTMGNPFETSEEGYALATVGNFAEVETIRRPYTPTLSDELQVSVGDRVKVLEIFNDGWASVEKLAEGDNQGKRGLVPIACLREANEDLSAFLHTRTVQSFHVAKQTVD